MRKWIVFVGVLLAVGLMGGVSQGQQGFGSNGRAFLVANTFGLFPLDKDNAIVCDSDNENAVIGIAASTDLVVRKVRAGILPIWETRLETVDAINIIGNGGALPDGRIWFHRRMSNFDTNHTENSMVILSAEGAILETVPLPDWTTHAWAVIDGIYVVGHRAVTAADDDSMQESYIPMVTRLDTKGHVLFAWDAEVDCDWAGEMASIHPLPITSINAMLTEDGLCLYGAIHDAMDDTKRFSFLIKLDSQGQVVLTYRTQTPDMIVCMDSLPDGGIVGICTSDSNSDSNRNYSIFKIDENGKLLFDERLSLIPGVYLMGIRPAKTGYIVYGKVFASGDLLESRLDGFISSAFPIVATFDADGRLGTCHEFRPSIFDARFVPFDAGIQYMHVQYMNRNDLALGWRVMPLDSVLGNALAVEASP